MLEPANKWSNCNRRSNPTDVTNA